MTKMGDGTVGGMIVYLDDLIIKNRAEMSKITPLKSAVKRVFGSIESGDWQQIKIDKVNTNELIEQFKFFCREGEFNEDTFAAYRARINRAVKWYKNYLEDHDWSPFKKTEFDELICYLNTNFSGKTAKSEDKDKMIEYPFPMSDGSLATLRLPKRLSQADAERLRMFIGSLAVGGR